MSRVSYAFAVLFAVLPAGVSRTEAQDVKIPSSVAQSVRQLADRGATIKVDGKFEVTEIVFAASRMTPGQTQLSVEDIAALKQLPSLETVEFQRVSVSDPVLAAMESLVQVRRISFEQVTGLGSSELTALRIVLPQTDVTAALSSRSTPRGMTNSRGRGGLVARGRAGSANLDVTPWLPAAVSGEGAATIARKLGNPAIQFELELTRGLRRQLLEVSRSGPSSRRGVYEYRGELANARNDAERDQLKESYEQLLNDEHQTVKSLLTEEQFARLEEIDDTEVLTLPSATLSDESLLPYIMTKFAQVDLKLTPDQLKTLNEMLAASPSRTTAIQKHNEQLAATRDLKARAELVKGRFQSLREEEQAIRELLTQSQYLGVQQRIWRSLGEHALVRPEVEKALNLTGDQREQLMALIRQSERRDGPTPDDFLNVLTDEQKVTWRQLLFSPIP